MCLHWNTCHHVCFHFFAKSIKLYEHTSKGRSFVDYFAVPIGCLNNCIKCEVKTARSLINEYCIPADIDVNLPGMIPDHSVLLLNVKTNSHTQPIPNTTTTTNLNMNTDTSHVPMNYFKRYNVQTVPVDFMGSEEKRQELVNIIEEIERCRNRQDEIDKVYEKLCDMYYGEMNRWFRARDVHPNSRKRLHKSTKPFWNEALQNLWYVLCESEKRYLKANGVQRRELHAQFKSDQKSFDRLYRKTERKYKYEQLCDIEKNCTSDPKKFWDTLRRIGPRKTSHIPLEVVDDNGIESNRIDDVLHKWKTEYEKLFSFVPMDGEFDEAFYTSIVEGMAELERTCHVLDGLNDNITNAEVVSVIRGAKVNKSVGLDNLPNEILKNESTIEVLTVLFQKVFELGLIPSLWKFGILKPIPKSSLTDPRVPLQYRGISLLSTVYKLFSGIVNKRIVRAVDDNGLYAEEQNGFRKDRSCIDHIFTLTSIIRNRKQRGLPTYTAYIDFEKAFDRIDRKLLFHKLMTMGVSGKILDCIKNIYDGCKCGVDVNGHITKWFSSNFGVRQGDALSPTLFGLYINDLVNSLKEGSQGITIEELVIVCLLYADDLVLISESEEDLQNMLNIVHDWCLKWRMKVNVSKSKIVHYRVRGHEQSSFDFKLGGQSLEIKDRYPYLGVVLDAHLNFDTTSGVLAESAGRALGTICNKFRYNKGFGFTTFSKLFHTGVAPILDYCSGVWGFGNHNKCDTIQNRAIRFFMGVHRFSPNLAINGDMGWVSCNTRRKVEMIRYWNRLQNMPDTSITKRVFIWDKRFARHNWSSNIKQIIDEIGIQDAFDNNMIIDVNYARQSLHSKMCLKWKEDVINVPKLRTYVRFKDTYTSETYLQKVSNRQHRSAISQFRCGILPLSIETGRYTNIPEEFRLCLMCDENVIESEVHFLLYCNKYQTIRQQFLQNIYVTYPQFEQLGDNEKLKILMLDVYVKETAKFIYMCYDLRRNSMYIDN